MKLYLRLAAESFKFAWQSLRANVLRTFLSLLGVTIGIFAIIAVLTLVDSMEKGLRDSFSMLGDDTLFINKWPWAPEDGKEYEWWRYFQRREPTRPEASELAERLTYASAVAFASQTVLNVESGNNNVPDIGILAVTHNYPETVKINLNSGRFFSELEADAGRPLAIIGSDLTLALFAGENPIGRHIKISGLRLEVIGTFKREGQSLVGNGFDQVVMVPSAFAPRIMDPEEVSCDIVVKAKEGIPVKQLKAEVIANFRDVRRVKPNAQADFAVNEASMISSMVDSIFSVVTLVGAIIGIMAGIVGCVNIANIMFVSVKERTGIIGIQKALGAKSTFILFQFLFESVVLCIMGGLLGLAIVFIGALIASASGFALSMGAGNFILGIGLSTFIGILAGIIPAQRAAKLNPVDAIRAN